MRRVVVQTFLSLDGVMQAPGGPDEDPTGGFTHGGWTVGYWDDHMGEAMGAAFSKPFDLLLGRRTYEIFAAHWPHTDADSEVAAPMNNATKYVASRTLQSVEWENSLLIPGDVTVYVAELRAGDGPEIQVHGSGDLVQTLLRHDLVDELRLIIFPVVLGSGKRLFGEGAVPAGLELAVSSTSSTGVILATYRTGADIRYGSFALEEPTAAELDRRAGL